MNKKFGDFDEKDDSRRQRKRKTKQPKRRKRVNRKDADNYPYFMEEKQFNLGRTNIYDDETIF